MSSSKHEIHPEDTPGAVAATKDQSRKPLRHLPFVLVLIGALVGSYSFADVLSFDTLRDNREALIAFRDQNYLGFVSLFLLGYVLIVAFSLPGAAVASVSGGFLFGLGFGTFFNVLAATVGASAIFYAARLGLGEALAARVDGREGRFARLKAALLQNEVEVLLLLRLVPAVPFFVANLLPALVGVRPRNFLWTTAVGIIPGALVFTWIGVGLGEVFDRGARPDFGLIWEPHILGPILGLCALAALPILIKALRGRAEI